VVNVGDVMYFKRIRLNEWQQFQNIDIDFHERLTILTGANGSGKTTILNLLAKHCGWQYSPLATPKLEKKTGIMRFLNRFFKGEDKSQDKVIGKLTYDSNYETTLSVPESDKLQYEILIQGQQPVNCFFIPSHGSIFAYRQIANIPTAKKNISTAFDEVSNTIREKSRGGSGQPSSFYMKNTLIGWAIRGFGVQDGSKSIMPKDQEQIDYYRGFQEVLKKLLPRTLGFEEFEIRNMEIVFVCNQGEDEFIFETASGGISAIIDIAWQIYMYSTKEEGNFTVLIDEVENHLHPTMQRQILPDLLDAFPNARFIVATHNPLIVNSERDSNIYVLKYNDENKVESEKLDFEKRPKTASEILDEVLGVSFTMPIWAEDALRSIVEKYTRKEMNESDFTKMRSELSDVGLERLMPHAIEEIIRGKND